MFFFSLVAHLIWGQSLVLGVPFLALACSDLSLQDGDP